MDNFLYCYLSPTILGLLIFIAVILGVVGALLAIYWLYDTHLYKLAHKVEVSYKVRKAFEATGNAALYILLGIIGAAICWLITMAAWELGLSILKRVMCT